MNSEDPSVRAEITGLRIELRELELRLKSEMADHVLRLAWQWVIAIWAASTALTVAILSAILIRS
ncbi:MAG TPA: hypothetical protein VK614_00120 [Allosphingosinicella sp.]|nr:hypothetical protein [Allosphingosinicella sp.]